MPNSDQSQEFFELVHPHQGELFSYIYACVHNFHDTEDVYQQTLDVLWRKLDTFDREGEFGRWAIGIARFEVANFLKKKRRHRARFSDTTLEGLELASEETKSKSTGMLSLLEDCMQKLSGSIREVLKLFYSGSSAAEIGKDRKQSVQGVYNTLCRGRRLLLECINRELAKEQGE